MAGGKGRPLLLLMPLPLPLWCLLVFSASMCACMAERARAISATRPLDCALPATRLLIILLLPSLLSADDIVRSNEKGRLLRGIYYSLRRKYSCAKNAWVSVK